MNRIAENPKRPLIGIGLRDGILTHVREVERGLACRCVCVACGSLLVAKKGDVLVHHFAHANGIDCGHAHETLVHLLAKEFLTVRKILTLPPVYVTPDDDEQCIYPYTDVVFSEISVERRLGNIIPDVVASTFDGRQLLVEIAVTHESSQAKIRKIATLGISAIEIPFPHCDILDFETARKIL